jgi:hypothetical protein
MWCSEDNLRANWGNWGSAFSLALYFIFMLKVGPIYSAVFGALCVKHNATAALVCVVTSGVFTTSERAHQIFRRRTAHLLCYSVQINRPYALSPALRNCGIQCVRTTFSLATHSTHGQGAPPQIEMTKGRSLEGEQKGPAELCLFYHRGRRVQKF